MNVSSNIVGKSKHAEHLRKLIAKLAANSKNVLIVGEVGVGKSTVASAISKDDIPVTVKLSTMEETEVQTTLSSITGGTIVLDGIDESGFRVQNIALKFIEAQAHRVRFIVTLNSPTNDLLVRNKLTEDVCARLNAFELVKIEPLRERPEDIPLLVKSFAQGLTIDINTLETLVNLPWKENIRQLRSVVEGCISSSEGGRFVLPREFIDERTEVAKTLSDLVESSRPALDKSLDVIENTIIRRTLVRFGFDTTKAAAFLGMTPQAFDQKLSRMVATNSDSR